MQIKRFEADDMNDALRQVKREFGDDAVILSAKEVRPGGFFSALRKKQVVITAAMDYQVTDGRQKSQFSGLLSQELDDSSPSDHVSLSSAASVTSARTADPPAVEPPAAGPIDEGAPEPAETKKTPPSASFAEAQRLVTALSALRRYGMGEMAASRASQTVIAASQTRGPAYLAEPFYRLKNTQQRIAFVGPSGAGKSSMVIKLARYCQAVEKKPTALISLDRFRIGANGLLENVARMMGLPYVLARNTDGLQKALTEYSTHAVVLIDTPGMGAMDQTMLEDVFSLLQTINPHETHLVVNATVRQKVISTAVETFSALGVNRLLPTHLDEYGSDDVAAELYATAELPAAFYGTGVDVFDGLREVRIQGGADPHPRFFPLENIDERKALSDSCREVAMASDSPDDPEESDGLRFLANRNSELFHHPSCKSVKRINLENIIAFNSAEQAMEEGFKPCRACCNVGMDGKSAFQPFAYQRSSAL